ncbi:MAG TPA: oxidoreductase [Ignavibacteriales bacterium]|nr:oxidoreductase [Ignavibacteriales bacterium]HOL81778.1 oxidoreductase [Ignavibacteriales bacterium]HPP33914.1 oxidoreductase [Ignavibacteriales bacterium]
MKNIIIIGGGGLIGQQLVNSFLDDSFNVVIADYNKENCKYFLNKLKHNYHQSKFKFIQVDINSKESLENLINQTLNIYNNIDAVINVAYPKNKNYGKDLLDVTYEDFCENINLHLGGYFLVMQIFTRFFIKQGYGNIINTASIYGVVAPKFDIYENENFTMPVEYAAIKSSIIHLTKYFAKYLIGKNIRVNCVSPGGIYNKHNENFRTNYKKYCINKGLLDVKDIVSVYKFLILDDSFAINGQNIIVDDGFTL